MEASRRKETDPPRQLQNEGESATIDKKTQYAFRAYFDILFLRLLRNMCWAQINQTSDMQPLEIPDALWDNSRHPNDVSENSPFQTRINHLLASSLPKLSSAVPQPLYLSIYPLLQKMQNKWLQVTAQAMRDEFAPECFIEGDDFREAPGHHYWERVYALATESLEQLGPLSYWANLGVTLGHFLCQVYNFPVQGVKIELANVLDAINQITVGELCKLPLLSRFLEEGKRGPDELPIVVLRRVFATLDDGEIPAELRGDCKGTEGEGEQRDYYLGHYVLSLVKKIERSLDEVVPMRPTTESPSTEADLYNVISKMSKPVVRALLTALYKKGSVRIAAVILEVWPKRDILPETLGKTITRANKELTEKGIPWEIKRQGETLLLAPL